MFIYSTLICQLHKNHIQNWDSVADTELVTTSTAELINNAGKAQTARSHLLIPFLVIGCKDLQDKDSVISVLRRFKTKTCKLQAWLHITSSNAGKV